MTAAKGVLRVALIQANPTVGAIDANLARALAYCESHKDADLVVVHDDPQQGGGCLDNGGQDDDGRWQGQGGWRQGQGW